MDLRASGSAPDHPGLRQSWSQPDVRLPTVVAIVGPNASGKSTILRAITSVFSFALDLDNSQTGQAISGFQSHLREQWMGRTIKICLEFDANWLVENAAQGSADLFRYELELNPDPNYGLASSVRREALSYKPKGRFRRVFERVENRHTYLGKEMRMKANDARIQAVRNNASFISTLAHLNHPLMQAVRNDLASMQSNTWHLNRLYPDLRTVVNYYIDMPDVLEQLQRDVRRIDVGINGVTIQQQPGVEPFFLFQHDTLSVPMVLQGESAGTQHFMVMFPMIHYMLQSGQSGVYDEFDADLHPDLVRELLGWFHSHERNPIGAQIFLTMHNVAALQDLEKEEVFLVEKSLEGATTIYGAQDVEGLRRDVSLERKYRSGALGALPNIG